MSSEHKAMVRQEYTQQPQAYAANRSIADQARLPRLVQAVQPRHKARVLDVATGPGYVAMAFAEAGWEVLGIDLTEAPLSIAEQKSQARELTNLRYQLGDAEHLPFEEQEFDIVVSRFALHHCEDPQRVLTEMARVCRVQGIVAIEDLVVSEYPARAAYQNPSAKAPVIDPGDEAPLLAWGGQVSARRSTAAMSRLTEANQPAMIGIDVL